MSNKRCVGELNGKWAALFQVSLIICPIIVGVIISMLGWLSYEAVLTSVERTVLKDQVAVIADKQQTLVIQLAKIEAMLADRKPTHLNTAPTPQTRPQPSGR